MRTPSDRNSPAPEVSWESADVEAATDAYARRFDGGVGAWFLEVQANFVLRLLQPLGPRLKLLEVGGGHAQLVPHLLAAGHTVTVVGSQEVCGKRLERWTRAGECSFEVGNLVDLPYPDEAYDVVTGFRLMAHVADWHRFTAELCRVARRAVVVDYPTNRSANAASAPLFRLKKGLEGDTRRFRVLSPAAVAAAFRANGFRIADILPQFFLPMALYRALGSAPLGRAVELSARLLGLTRLLGSPVIVRADRGATRQ